MYSSFANEFSNTRTRPWPCVEDFLTRAIPRGLLLDAGCGNGRNLLRANELGFDATGFDICPEFVHICKSRGLRVYRQSIEDRIIGHYHAIMCIAVLHHIQSDKARQCVLQSLYSALLPGGSMLITVWSFETTWNTSSAKYPRSFTVGDNTVPWKSGSSVADRYYYIYNREELDAFLGDFQREYPEALIEVNWEEQNWNITIIRPGVVSM